MNFSSENRQNKCVKDFISSINVDFDTCMYAYVLVRNNNHFSKLPTSSVIVRMGNWVVDPLPATIFCATNLSC